MRTLLQRIGFGYLLIIVAATSAVSAERPNIVLIMADDLGAECLSCYGCLDYKTPHLDALAASGAKFTHAHAQPLCTPTRVQLMTGKYNFRNYVEFGYLSPDETTFGDLMRHGGYATCVAGKWQLSGQGRQYPEQTNPADWGFDEHCLWQLNNRAPYGDRGSRFWNPYVERNGKVVTPGPDAYGPDVYTEFLLDFVERHQDQPFFAYYPMALTHSPYEPTPDSKEREKKNVRYFKDMVEYMDTIVGRIVAKLDELNLSDNTIVIFTGDNGTGREVTTNTTAGKILGGKGTTTNAGTHVPMIVRWPGKIAAGTVTDRLIDFTDFTPSLLAAANIQPTEDFMSDGVPFLDETGLSSNKRDAVYCWYEPRHGENSARNNAIFARDHRYKLYSDGRFFDVAKTPLEASGDQISGDLSSEQSVAKQKLQAVIDLYAEQGAVIAAPGEVVPRERPRRQGGGRKKATSASE